MNMLGKDSSDQRSAGLSEVHGYETPVAAVASPLYQVALLQMIDHHRQVAGASVMA